MAKRQSAEFWQDHLEAWKRSGLTQVAYCSNNEPHIKAFSLRHHQKREVAQLSIAIPPNNPMTQEIAQYSNDWHIAIAA